MQDRLITLRRRLDVGIDWALAGLMMLFVVPLLAIPPDWAVRLVGAVGGWLIPRILSGRRISRNLARIWPHLTPEEVRRLQAEVGEHFGRVLAEYFRLDTLARRPDRRHVTGFEHVEAAMRAGRGVVIASAHIGHWEQIRLAAADRGVPVGIIYRAFNNHPFDLLSQIRIRAAGEPVLHKGRQGLRDMLAHLKAGGAILVLMDQHSTGGAVLPLLGHPAVTATAIPALCARIGAALVPARAIREADGHSFAVSFEPAMPQGDPVQMTAAMNDRIGAWITETPGQWFWLHRRWREPAA